MLYGAVTMGACYLIAALCLEAGEDDPSRRRLVSGSCPFVPMT